MKNKPKLSNPFKYIISFISLVLVIVILMYK